MAAFDRRLYGRWVVANAWSELLGLGGTFAIGWWTVSRTGEPTTPVALIGMAFLAVAGGTVLEGLLVGYAQGRVVHRRLPALSARRWILATAVGAGLAWLLGMIPSTIMSLTGPVVAEPSAPPAWMEGPLQYLLAAAMGLVLGPVLALPQTLVLRHHTERAARWVLANALAWAVGMPIVFAGAGNVSPSAPLGATVAILGGTCLVAGAAVGAVHGVFLVSLLGSAGPRRLIL